MAKTRKKKKKYTKRGFRIDEFNDLYGKKCSIQESSLATRAAIWLGCEEGTHYDHEGRVVVIPQDCSARMHVDKPLARYLVRRLNTFLRTGAL
jgi:hypothetical protein